MLFKKGLLEGIDQRHYFRDVVFAGLNWKQDAKRSHYERATAQFNLIVNGVDAGNFKLKLSHNTNTASATYRQNNSMTSISWGEAKTFTGKDENIGKNAALYGVEGSSDAFVLVIG